MGAAGIKRGSVRRLRRAVATFCVAVAAGLVVVLASLAGPAGAAAARPWSLAAAAGLRAGPGWVLQRAPIPAGAYASELTGVSCASATACTAVGYAYKHLGTQLPTAFAEAWNGTTWSVQAVPKPPGSAFSI